VAIEHNGVTIMNRRHLLPAMLAVAMLSTPAVAQAPQPWTQVGALSCKVNPNIGLVIAGHQPMECLFTPNTPDPPQAYDGAINTVGLNVGVRWWCVGLGRFCADHWRTSWGVSR
jgi:hypothetical protein